MEGTRLDVVFYEIEARTAGLDAGIAEARQKLASLPDKGVTVPVAVNAAPAEQGARRVTKAMADTSAAATELQATAKGAGRDLAEAFSRSALGVGVATTSLVALGAALIKTADDYQLVTNRLKLVTAGSAELAATQARLRTIADDTFQSLGPTVDLYARLARSSQALGLTQQELYEVTEATSAAVKLSGVSAQAAEAGLIQLGQAFASGTLRGDELRSVLEQLPRLAEAIATGLGVTVGELRALGETGQLTSEQVAKALASQLGTLKAESASVGPTLAQSTTLITNAVTAYIAEVNTATGATSTLGSITGAVARNFEAIADAAVLAGAVYTGRALGPMIEKNAELALAEAARRTAVLASADAEIAAALASEKAAMAAAEQAAALAASTDATLAALAADRAFVVAETEKTLVLQRAAQAAVAAAVSETELVLANERLAASTAELVVLGTQQQNIARATAAAEATRAAATQAAATATSEAAVAATVATGAMAKQAATAGLLSRALAFVGGPVGAAVTLALVGISVAVNRAREEKERATKSTNDYIASLEQLTRTELQAELARKQTQRDSLGAQFAGRPQERYRATTDDGRTMRDLDGEIAVLNRRLATLGTEAKKAAAVVSSDLARAAEDGAERNRIFARSGEQAAEAFTKAAGSFKDAAGMNRSFTKALADGDAAAAAHLESITKIVQIDAEFTSAKERATQATQKAEQAQRQFADASKDLDTILRDITLKLEEKNKRDQQQRDGIDAFKRAQQEKLTLLDAELEALTAGPLALKQYAEVQAVRLAGDRAVADALRIKNDLGKEELQTIRATAEEEQRRQLRNAAASNTGRAIALPSREELDTLVNAIGTALGAAQGLASAFGEVGDAVANAAGKAENLVSALARSRDVGKVTGADGKVSRDEGFFGALSGKAGAAGVLGAVGTGFAVFGALKGLGDAIDLFGSKAKQRAKEIADATRAFSEGLTAFRARAFGEDTQVGSDLTRAVQEYAALIALANKAFKGSTLTREQQRLNAALDAEQARIAADFFTTLDGALESLAGDETTTKLRELAAVTRERENAVIALRKSGAISQAEEVEALTKIRAIFDLTTAQIEEAAAAADATKRFESASREFAARARLFNIEGVQYVGGLVDVLAARFPELAGILEGVDVATAEGLAALKARAQTIFDTLAAGGLTVAEQEIVDGLFAIIDAAEQAGPVLASFANTVNTALAAVGRDNDIMGGDARTRFGRLSGAAAGLSDQLAAILGAVDLSSAAGIDDVKQRLRQLYTTLLVDGISDDESPIVDLIRSLLGGLDDVLAETEGATQTAIERARTRSRAIIEAFDLEGADAFTETLTGFGAAFQTLFGSFDVNTIDGVARAKDAVRALLTGIREGTADLAAFGGLVGEDVINVLLELDGSLDGLADAARSARDATTSFVNDLNLQYLDATGQGLEAVRLQTELWVEGMIAQATALGVASDDTIARIRTIARARIQAAETQAAKNAPTAAEARTSQEIVTNTVAATETLAVSRWGSITTADAMSLNAVMLSTLVETREIRGYAARMAGALDLLVASAGLPALSVPALPPGVSIGGEARAPISVIINVNGPIAGMTPAEAGQRIAEPLVTAINQALGRAAGIDRRGQGSMS